MHETSLVASMVDVVRDQAFRHGMSRVTGLKVRIGAMRMVVPELLHSAFDMMSRGTLAEGAVLEIEWVPLVARCGSCRREVEMQEWTFLCPVCGAVLTEILSGREMDLVEMTGEQGESR